jgi:hypothetical protein
MASRAVGRRPGWLVLLILALLAPLAPPGPDRLLPAVAGASAPTDPQAVLDQLAGSPLLVVENVGQFGTSGSTGSSVRFQVRGAQGGTIWLTDDGLWLTIYEAVPAVAQTTFRTGAPPLPKTVTVPANQRYTVVVHETAEGVGRNNGAGWAVSTWVITSHLGGIVVERPMYSQ